MLASSNFFCQSVFLQQYLTIFRQVQLSTGGYRTGISPPAFCSLINSFDFQFFINQARLAAQTTLPPNQSSAYFQKQGNFQSANYYGSTLSYSIRYRGSHIGQSSQPPQTSKISIFKSFIYPQRASSVYIGILSYALNLSFIWAQIFRRGQALYQVRAIPCLRLFLSLTILKPQGATLGGKAKTFLAQESQLSSEGSFYTSQQDVPNSYQGF